MTLVNSILQHTSFNTLDDAGQKAVRRLFATYQQDGGTLNLPMVDLFKSRLSLAETCKAYKSRIQKINQASFKFLNQAQKLALDEELLFSFYIFSAQFDLDASENRYQNLKELSGLIKQCAELRCFLNRDKDEFKEELDANIAAYGRHLKYLGLTEFAKITHQLEKDNTLTKTEKWQKIDEQLESELFGGAYAVLKEMAAFNERRLYWVWGDGFLGSILSLLPKEFPHLAETGQTLDFVRNISGYVGWILYYSRLGLNLALVFKHTFEGPWMGEKERVAKISTFDRFKFQLDHRKFALLNDAIWATVNLVTFFWLAGNGWLGYSGNVLTLGLLLVDTALTVWQCYEDDLRQQQTIKRFADDIKILQEKMNSAEPSSDQYSALLIEIEKLEALKKKAKIESRYARYKIAAGLSYSLGLMAGFTVMCCILPPGVLPITALALGVAGAAVCFALTVAYTATNTIPDIVKTLHLRKLNQQQVEKLKERIEKSGDENEQRLLYLDILRLNAEMTYQSKQAAYQSAQMLRGLLIDCMIPVLVFASLTFMPTGIGIAVIATGIALAVLSKVLINQFEPKAAQLPQWDEDRFTKYKTKPEKEKRQHIPAIFSIFGQKPSVKKRSDDQEPLLDNSSDTPITPSTINLTDV